MLKGLWWQPRLPPEGNLAGIKAFWKNLKLVREGGLPPRQEILSGSKILDKRFDQMVIQNLVSRIKGGSTAASFSPSTPEIRK